MIHRAAVRGYPSIRLLKLDGFSTHITTGQLIIILEAKLEKQNLTKHINLSTLLHTHFQRHSPRFRDERGRYKGARHSGSYTPST